jgi:hypothetical protein
VVFRRSWKSLIAEWARQLHLPLLIGLVALQGLLSPRATAHADDSNLPLGRPNIAFAVEDFDGDFRPDLVSVQAVPSNSSLQIYTVEIRLSSGPQQSIRMAARTGSLRIAARDVNGDSVPDLVITSVRRGEPLAVLLNDGKGEFSSVDPSSFPELSENSEWFETGQLPPPMAVDAASSRSLASGLSEESSPSHSKSSTGFVSRPSSALDLSPLLVSLPSHAPPRRFLP